MSIGFATLIPLDHTTVSVRDLVQLRHVLVVSSVDTDVAVPAFRETTGIDMPAEPGTVCDAAIGTAFWLSPRSWLLRLPANGEAAVLDGIGTGFPDHRIHAMPYSDALHWFEITGPGGAGLLARGGFVSLSTDGFPTGHCKRTLIADIPLLIWRRETDVWEIGCERSRARYFSDWVESSIAISEGAGLP